jgi:hypothetical protein
MTDDNNNDAMDNAMAVLAAMPAGPVLICWVVTRIQDGHEVMTPTTWFYGDAAKKVWDNRHAPELSHFRFIWADYSVPSVQSHPTGWDLDRDRIKFDVSR